MSRACADPNRCGPRESWPSDGERWITTTEAKATAFCFSCGRWFRLEKAVTAAKDLAGRTA